MRKILCLFILLVCFIPSFVNAQRGCCSHHGGVAGCSSSGRQVCNDGTLSPSCTCQPTYIYGCTDWNSINYNPNANKDDGSCIEKKYGCMDNNAINYDSRANVSDSSCNYLEIQKKKKVIKYKTINKYNDEKNNDYELTIQNGQNGEKEIAYEIIKNEKGEVISKKITEEKIIVEVVDEIIEKGTSKPLPIGAIFWMLFGIMVPIYSKFLNKNSNTIFSVILNMQGKIKIVYYTIYYIFIIPPFIDAAIIIFDLYKNIRYFLSQKSN